jgi:hypothetical protein
MNLKASLKGKFLKLINRFGDGKKNRVEPLGNQFIARRNDIVTELIAIF